MYFPSTRAQKRLGYRPGPVDARARAGDRRPGTRASKEREDDEVSASQHRPDRSLRRVPEGRGAIPARSDARADARLQYRVHRLREDPRVRVEQGPPHRRGVPRLGRAMPCARRLDLRRRAAHLQGDRGRRRRASSRCAEHPALHERAATRGDARPVRAEPEAHMGDPSRRHAGDPRLRLRLPRPLGDRDRRDQGGPRPGSASRRTRRFSRRPRSTTLSR